MSSRGKGESRGHESQRLPDGLRPLSKKGPEHKTGMLNSRKFSQTPVVSFFHEAIDPHTVWRVFFKQTSVAIVIVFWLKWAGYLAVAGLNLLAQISDRISPFGV